MKRLFVGVAASAVAALAVIGGVPRIDPVQPKVRKEPERDSRRKGPSVHRASAAELAVRNRVARAEALKLQRKAHAASVPATAWVNLGPTNAFDEFNSVEIPGVDSGRPNAILVDPRDANVVYIATSGGGMWKTFNFLSADGPSWSPVSDLFPNLAVGALALDAANPDVVYMGTGDFIDGSGNTIFKSIDGGGSWSAPIVLDGKYPNGTAATVGAIRTIAANGSLVLAGTDAGLFASTDGGVSFNVVDLPNRSGKVVAESIWSVLPTGGGHWVATGVTGCTDQGDLPSVYFGQDPGTNCPEGNNGTIWTSPDGATWSLATQPMNTGIGRLTLAAGGTADPAHTVVYAYVGAVDNGSTLGFWRSNDGGATFVDATGTLANPTKNIQGYQDCESINLGHDQTWYNQAIVVDPTNPDHVLVGGNLCGARTLNGTSATPKWELVSHWLPGWDGGSTDFGQLPYVHADWHTATSVATPAGVRTFAGTDGGIFSSTNLFDTGTQAESVVWTHHNKGLITHLVYAIGSGDPATSNPFVLFGGLQDNGTRFRADPHQPSVFNQPIGGDGIGATVHSSSSGTTYWASVEFGRVYCQPSDSVDCALGSNWQDLNPTLNALAPEPENFPSKIAGEDMEPFFEHYANVETDTTGQSVLTHSTGQVFVSVRATDGTLSWQAISQDLTPAQNGFANVTASRTIPGLYGAAGTVSRAPFYFTTAGNAMSTWTVSKPVFPTGDTKRLTGASSIDFPPVTPAGKQPGQVFIGAFSGTMNDTARTPPPDDKGHLYRTTDFGQTWTSIVGADPAHRLPNVPVYVVKYDPVTPTTIYAGTDLGVYISLDDGTTWDRMGEGLPMVPVRDIYVAKNQDFIRVATYGRGIWEIYPSANANPGAPGNGDYDRNLRLDWVDLAAMSSRMGETPATTTQPFYSWILDMVSIGSDLPKAAIDDADLSALLAKFGGHP